jgi:hypothetical protein
MSWASDWAALKELVDPPPRQGRRGVGREGDGHRVRRFRGSAGRTMDRDRPQRPPQSGGGRGGSGGAAVRLPHGGLEASPARPPRRSLRDGTLVAHRLARFGLESRRPAHPRVATSAHRAGDRPTALVHERDGSPRRPAPHGIEERGLAANGPQGLLRAETAPARRSYPLSEAPALWEGARRKHSRGAQPWQGKDPRIEFGRAGCPDLSTGTGPAGMAEAGALLRARTSRWEYLQQHNTARRGAAANRGGPIGNH